MSPEILSTLFDYHFEQFDRLWDIAEQLPSDAFIAETDYSLGSLRNHFVHCLSVEERWLARLQERGLPPLLDFADYPAPAPLRQHWNRYRGQFLAYSASLSAAASPLNPSTRQRTKLALDG